MIGGIANLSTSDLEELSASLRSGRLRAPFTAIALQRILSPSAAASAADAFRHLSAVGVPPEGVCAMLDVLVTDRTKTVSVDDAIDLVISGPDAGLAANRDTAVVVRDLFAYATRSVWIAGYAVHKGRRVFEALADRMVTQPDLDVVLLLDVRRGPGDTTIDDDLVRRFEKQFREREWPEGRPIPRVFYYPQSLRDDAQSRAALHAKCVVIDSESCFVSSANFTEAAQNKNIEVGLLVRSAVVATRLQRYLQLLVDGGIVQRML